MPPAPGTLRVHLPHIACRVYCPGGPAPPRTPSRSGPHRPPLCMCRRPSRRLFRAIPQSTCPALPPSDRPRIRPPWPAPRRLPEFTCACSSTPPAPDAPLSTCPPAPRAPTGRLAQASRRRPPGPLLGDPTCRGQPRSPPAPLGPAYRVHSHTASTGLPALASRFGRPKIRRAPPRAPDRPIRPGQLHARCFGRPQNPAGPRHPLEPAPPDPASRTPDASGAPKIRPTSATHSDRPTRPGQPQARRFRRPAGSARPTPPIRTAPPDPASRTPTASGAHGIRLTHVACSGACLTRPSLLTPLNHVDSGSPSAY
ncbi:hypothetical protein BKA14_000781 [Actinoplanes abujensis]|uniref:Uncharacterized protein n=1 Tax=Paractinoplanes abujensis TaxID=882441 RepID=A0A7W7CP58_9ACTN|nr:hypothetical protein [Actinoplanes abujensis]